MDHLETVRAAARRRHESHDELVHTMANARRVYSAEAVAQAAGVGRETAWRWLKRLHEHANSVVFTGRWHEIDGEDRSEPVTLTLTEHYREPGSVLTGTTARIVDPSWPIRADLVRDLPVRVEIRAAGHTGKAVAVEFKASWQESGDGGDPDVYGRLMRFPGASAFALLTTIEEEA